MRSNSIVYSANIALCTLRIREASAPEKFCSKVPYCALVIELSGHLLSINVK